MAPLHQKQTRSQNQFSAAVGSPSNLVSRRAAAIADRSAQPSRRPSFRLLQYERSLSSSTSPFPRQSLERPFRARGIGPSQTNVTFTQGAVDFAEGLRSSVQQKESAEPRAHGESASPVRMGNKLPPAFLADAHGDACGCLRTGGGRGNGDRNRNAVDACGGATPWTGPARVEGRSGGSQRRWGVP
jgi:hypothetical protein